MNKLSLCIYGGGSSCKRQGGSGSLWHSSDYYHSYLSPLEFGKSCSDYVEPVNDSDVIVKASYLEDFFDEDLSFNILNVPFDDLIDTNKIVKSLYDFDLDSKDGILKLLESLPIMDREILFDISEKIWPGYIATDKDPDLVRYEIKGYLLDYLYAKF